MARRFPRSVQRSTNRRQTTWSGLPSGTDKVAVPAASAVLLSQLDASDLALRPFTVIRTRGRVLVKVDQTVGNEEPQLVLGMMVVSDSAGALGITAILDPVSNPDGEWILYEDMPIGITPDGDGNIVDNVFEFDSKAMRKVGHDEDVVLVVGNRSAADGAFIIVSGRVLFKLH